LVDLPPKPWYNALEMKRFLNLVYSKFQEWAINDIDTIVWQWVGYSLIEGANGLGFFDATFAYVQWNKASQVLDWLWYIDTAYVVTSAGFRLLFHPKRRPPPNF
jgi:hypothetical protein